MFFESNEFEIAGIACAVPDEVESVDKWIGRFGEDAVQKFTRSTGVKQRFIGTHLGVTASDLCCAAAKQLMDGGLFAPDEIDAVIFMSVRRDYESPATAFIIQHRLGLKEDCVCLDVPLGCSAYCNGFLLAGSLMRSGCEMVLLLTGESMYKETETPKSIPMHFGAAGSATLIRKKEGIRAEGLIRSYGNDFRLQAVPYSGFRHLFEKLITEEGIDRARELYGKFYMDSFETMRFSLGTVVDCIKKMMAHFGASQDDFDYFVLPQSNAMIINGLSQKMKFPQEKMLVSIDHYANTSGASIPVTLCHCLGGSQDAFPKKVFGCGYGIGLSVGVVSFFIEPKNCLPVTRVKERWDDGIDPACFD